MLRKENEDAARIFRTVRGQTIDRMHIEAGPGGVVAYSEPKDLNHAAVWAAIDAYGVRGRVGCFEKVLTLFFARLNEDGGE